MKRQSKVAVVLVAVTPILRAATDGGPELYKHEELQRSESTVENRTRRTAPAPRPG